MNRWKTHIKKTLNLLLPLPVKSALQRFNVKRITKGACEGLKIYAYGALPEYVNGSYELPLQKVLSELLTPGNVFYDIGANFGFFTLLAARKVGLGGHVYAFEPIAANAARIRLNVRLNRFDQVSVIEKAVSDNTGIEDIWVTRFAGGATLASTDIIPEDAIRKISVDTIRLDEMVEAKILRPPTLLKIDVEGAEMQVLEGMAGTLAKYRPFIVYEIDDGQEREFSKKVKDTQSLLRDLGYLIDRLEDSYTQENWLISHFVARPGKRNRPVA
jgi:FkbM family methyltransferase